MPSFPQASCQRACSPIRMYFVALITGESLQRSRLYVGKVWRLGKLIGDQEDRFSYIVLSVFSELF